MRIAAIACLRNSPTPIGRALRRGKLYPRETAYLGYPFSLPKQGEIVAWSMVHYQTAVIVALNTHASEARGADVTIDAYLHPEGSTLTVLYRSDWSDEELQNPPQDQTVTVKHDPDGRATVRVDLPPAGMMILS